MYIDITQIYAKYFVQVSKYSPSKYMLLKHSKQIYFTKCSSSGKKMHFLKFILGRPNAKCIFIM